MSFPNIGKILLLNPKQVSKWRKVNFGIEFGANWVTSSVIFLQPPENLLCFPTTANFAIAAGETNRNCTSSKIQAKWTKKSRVRKMLCWRWRAFSSSALCRWLSFSSSFRIQISTFSLRLTRAPQYLLHVMLPREKRSFLNRGFFHVNCQDRLGKKD